MKKSCPQNLPSDNTCKSCFDSKRGESETRWIKCVSSISTQGISMRIFTTIVFRHIPTFCVVPKLSSSSESKQRIGGRAGLERPIPDQVVGPNTSWMWGLPNMTAKTLELRTSTHHGDITPSMPVSVMQEPQPNPEPAQQFWEQR